MAENERDTEGLIEFLKMRRGDIPEDTAPWTRDWVELLILNGESYLKSGKEFPLNE